MFSNGNASDMRDLRAATAAALELARSAHELAKTASTEGHAHYKFCEERERKNDDRHASNTQKLETISRQQDKFETRLLWQIIGILVSILLGGVSLALHNLGQIHVAIGSP
jgi:hypothetical protein